MLSEWKASADIIFDTPASRLSVSKERHSDTIMHLIDKSLLYYYNHYYLHFNYCAYTNIIKLIKLKTIVPIPNDIT